MTSETKSSNTLVQSVASCSNSAHRFPWKWYLSDIEKVKKNGCKVFSTFSCGGGSSMGYKLAGYEVLGNCEIDPAIMKIYQNNNHPKYSYLMDIRDFCSKDDLPDELYDLDILDGSPPCSTFSMAGNREKDWGKEKQFREGQKMQTLDDLFFYYLDLVEKLKPKIAVAENVTGIIKGNAKGYCNLIIKRFNEIGYDVQIFKLNSAFMGVPQRRERVFFIGKRKDLKLPKLVLDFNEKIITFGEVRSEHGDKFAKEDSKHQYYLRYRKPTDTSMSDIYERIFHKTTCFTDYIWSDNKPSGTLASAGQVFRGYDGLKGTSTDFVNVQTFPQDYDFTGSNVKYVCGMSVPPVMMAQISSQIYDQLLSKL